MGFPLITVSETQEVTRRVLKLRQERFIADGGKGEGLWQVCFSLSIQVFKIPINITTSADPSKIAHRFLLTKAEDEVVLENVKENDWVKLNAGAGGFFRVQ